VRHAREGDEPWTWNEPALLELVPPPGALSVDAGCGEGRFTRTLRKRGHSTVAFDSTTALIDAARAADPSGEYLVADVTSLLRNPRARVRA
jgi:trans-aconitate methyltransferase